MGSTKVTILLRFNLFVIWPKHGLLDEEEIADRFAIAGNRIGEWEELPSFLRAQA
jgi:hypothetical protein